MGVREANRPGEGIRDPRAQVKDKFELPDVGLENQFAHCALDH